MEKQNKKRIEEKYNVSERNLATASEISKKLKIPVKVIQKLFEPIEWHHSQVYSSYNYDGVPTDYYNLQEIENVLNKNYDNDYYDKKDLDVKHEQLKKELENYKQEQKKAHDIIKEIIGYFGYSNYDGSNSFWYKGKAIFKKNGWWYLPDGKRKKEIIIIDEKQFERKRNKRVYVD
jgi:hypothetical protein